VTSGWRACTQRLGRGRGISRCACPQGKDELDELGRAFDRMVAELGRRARASNTSESFGLARGGTAPGARDQEPVNAIQLAVQEIASKYPGDDPRTGACWIRHGDPARRDHRLRRLVEDFSAFAKLPKVEPTPLDLVPWWRRSCACSPNGSHSSRSKPAERCLTL